MSPRRKNPKPATPVRSSQRTRRAPRRAGEPTPPPIKPRVFQDSLEQEVCSEIGSEAYDRLETDAMDVCGGEEVLAAEEEEQEGSPDLISVDDDPGWKRFHEKVAERTPEDTALLFKTFVSVSAKMNGITLRQAICALTSQRFKDLVYSYEDDVRQALYDDYTAQSEEQDKGFGQDREPEVVVETTIVRPSHAIIEEEEEDEEELAAGQRTPPKKHRSLLALTSPSKEAQGAVAARTGTLEDALSLTRHMVGVAVLPKGSTLRQSTALAQEGKPLWCIPSPDEMAAAVRVPTTGWEDTCNRLHAMSGDANWVDIFTIHVRMALDGLLSPDRIPDLEAHYGGNRGQAKAMSVRCKNVGRLVKEVGWGVLAYAPLLLAHPNGTHYRAFKAAILPGVVELCEGYTGHDWDDRVAELVRTHFADDIRFFTRDRVGGPMDPATFGIGNS